MCIRDREDTLQTRWDGRDGSGKVVEEGSYVIEVDAIDAFDNRGGACTADLAVVQEVP